MKTLTAHPSTRSISDAFFTPYDAKKTHFQSFDSDKTSPQLKQETFFLLPLLALSGCAKYSGQLSLSGCDETILVQSWLEEEDAQLVFELIDQAMSSLEGLFPEWNCRYKKIIMKSGDVKSAWGAYNPNSDAFKFYFEQSWIDAIKFENPDSQEYQLAMCKIYFVIFHEIGHYICDQKFVDMELLETFGLISFDYNPKNSGAHLNNSVAVWMNDNWTLNPSAMDQDFIGNSVVGEAYGKESMGEDFAQVFAKVIMDFIVYETNQQEVFDYPIITFTEPYVYSELAQMKYDLLMAWLQGK